MAKVRSTIAILCACLLATGILSGCGAGAKQSLPALSKEMVTDAEIFVDPIAGLSEDFMRGVDVSSYLTEKNSGVKFYDFAGNELGDAEFFGFLADCGINWIRLRVWVDPYDENGNGYGGGNNDIAAAVKMGKWATDAGLKVLIDFHYSDFWADPNKQMAPKAWASMNNFDKAKEIEKWTTSAMKELKNGGVNVGMVQIGNETTNGFCGEKSWEIICSLFNSAAKSIRKADKKCLIAVHFTNPEHPEELIKRAEYLKKYNVDYDVFACSYYAFWHGTPENLTEVLSKVANDYSKKVLVAETSWPYTLDEGDGSGNTVAKGSNDVGMPYAFSVQGQATEVATVIDAVNNIGDAGLGVFYWEPAWIPVGVVDMDSSDATAVYESNRKAWESMGSGWASSYAAGYDPKDAGQYYGGSAVDNQAMFDFYGHPLDSINVWKYVYSGASSPDIVIDKVEDTGFSADIVDDFKGMFPAEVKVTYNNREEEMLPVVWDTTEVLSTRSYGVYVVSGVVEKDGQEHEARCEVTLAPTNFLNNGDMESGHAGWVIAGNGVDDKTGDDPHSGEGSMHFWSEDTIDFTVSQNVNVDKDCSLGAYMYVQGGDMGDGKVITLTVTNVTTGESLCTDSELTGWQQWKMLTIEGLECNNGDQIEVQIAGKGPKKGWGTIDDIFLYPMME